MDAFERPLFPGDGDSVYDDACSGRAFAPLALSIRNPETSHYTLKLRTAVGTCATFTSEWPSVLSGRRFRWLPGADHQARAVRVGLQVTVELFPPRTRG